MKLSSILAATGLAVASFTPLAQANTQDAVYELAQGCYAVQSPATGRYLQLYYSGGTINDGMNYKFNNIDINQAAHFYMKPSQLGSYLMTDKAGRYLASRLPAEETAGTYAGKFAEWTLNAVQGNGEYLYTFHGTGLDMKLRHYFPDGELYFFDLLNPNNNNSENTFRLVPQSDCVDFPEITTNVAGNPDVLKGDVNEPVRGFVDPHTHLTSYEFMGGKMMAGAPFSRWGVEDALRDSSDKHGPDGSLDLIGNLYAYGDANHRYDTRGYPDFPFWPNAKQLSHSGYYYKWMERAWLSGQRIMVTHLVENEVLCRLQSTINPASWIDPNSCNTMDSIELQVNRMREIENYIDAQAGGPGKGFFKVVKSAQEAREVIADGKLAVIMGVEASEVLNCGEKDACSYADVQYQLDKLYNWGIRALFPIHKFDNRLGGSVVEDGLINIGEWLSTGHFFRTEECDAETKGQSMTPGFPELGGVPVIGDIVNTLTNAPNYDTSIEHCNQTGMTALGEFLINEMIDKNMLIELDHMSTKAATAVLDIAEARNYSGLISSHSWMPDAKLAGELHYNMKRVINLGGFVTPYNSDAYGITMKIDSYLTEVEKTPYLPGVGFATDMSGLGGQAGPRYDGATNPLEYPFTSEFGLVFDKQVSGNRVFDISNEGVAHYGLVADHLQDIRVNGSTRVYESVMNSAEAYLQMWERAENNTSVAPAPDKQEIISMANGLCMNIWGGSTYNGAPIRLHPCVSSIHDDWTYEASTGFIRSALNPDYCLSAGEMANGKTMNLWQCIDNHPNQVFEVYANSIRPRADTGLALDAFGNSRGDNIGLWHSHGGANQQWLIDTGLPDLAQEYTSEDSGLCMNVWGGKTQNGAPVRAHPCMSSVHDNFIYDAGVKVIRTALNPNYCLALTNGIEAGSTVHVWECYPLNNNLLFDIEDGVITPTAFPTHAVTMFGNYQGADVGIAPVDGSATQSWNRN